MTDLMQIERWQPGDEAVRDGIAAAAAAALDIDDPDGPRMTGRVLGVWLQYGFGCDPAEAWYVAGPEPGSVLGWYRLELFRRENRDRAGLLVVVHPGQRRRGLGRALLRHAAQRVAADGRTILDGEVRDGTAGDAFAVAVGAKSGIGETLRRLDLRRVPAERFSRLHAGAAAAATGYSLLRWAGEPPAEQAAALARVVSAYADAPHDEGVEDEVWDAARVTENAQINQLMGTRSYTVAARHDASGELAAMTHLNVSPDAPRWGHQGLTAVTREHRGHRLGLLVKTDLMSWLAQAEPALEEIETGNASDNAHMIAVNDQLGYVPALPAFHSCELAVAAVQAD